MTFSAVSYAAQHTFMNGTGMLSAVLLSFLCQHINDILGDDSSVDALLPFVRCHISTTLVLQPAPLWQTVTGRAKLEWRKLEVLRHIAWVKESAIFLNSGDAMNAREGAAFAGASRWHP